MAAVSGTALGSSGASKEMAVGRVMWRTLDQCGSILAASAKNSAVVVVAVV